jgi:hypothetical protein
VDAQQPSKLSYQKFFVFSIFPDIPPESNGVLGISWVLIQRIQGRSVQVGQLEAREQFVAEVSTTVTDNHSVKWCLEDGFLAKIYTRQNFQIIVYFS